jgi:hypothetical protein
MNQNINLQMLSIRKGFRECGRRLLSKKISLLIAGSLFLSLNSLQAQVVLADFETTETTPTLSVADGSGTASVIANPFVDNVNGSSHVGSYTKSTGNWHYLNLKYDKQMSFGKQNTLKLKVYSTIPGRVFVKFIQDNENNKVFEKWAVDYNTIPAAGKWNEFTVDVTEAMGKSFNILQIATCVDNTTQTGISYVDDVVLSNPLAGEGYPVVGLNINPSIIYKDSTITFDASGSYDWNDLPLSYSWNFGDGSSATGANKLTHVFTQSGMLDVALQVSNTKGKVTTKHAKFIVIDRAQKFTSLVATPSKPEVYKKVEVYFQTNKFYKNPYNPDSVMVDAIITKPDQSTYSLPCFYYVKANKSSDSWVSDSSFQCWALRFMPDVAGDYQVKIKLTEKGSEYYSAPTTISVSASQNKGFVCLDTANNKQFYRYSTGEPYFPLGQNVAWSNKNDKITDFTNQINQLSENGANFMRYWTVPFSQTALEWRAGIGTYKGIGYYNQEAAALLDSIFDVCNEKGVQLQLAIFQHGMLSENVNPNWVDNPYNAAVDGGYLSHAADFYSNAKAKASIKKLLRYYVARWAYSTNLFAWEFFNEVDLSGNTTTNGSAFATDVNTWHTEMGEYVRSLDPYKHPRTTSVSDVNHAVSTLLSVNNVIDIMQFHSYGSPVESTILGKYATMNGKTTKPLICGEYGNADATESAVSAKIAGWCSFFKLLPSMDWDWDKAIKDGFYPNFKALAVFSGQSDLSKTKIDTTISLSTVSNISPLYAVALRTDSNYYAYVYDRSAYDSISNAKVIIHNVAYGTYKVQIYSTSTGEILSSYSKDFINPKTPICLPKFYQDIAVKLIYEAKYVHPIAITSDDAYLGFDNSVNVSGAASLNPKGLTLTGYKWTIVSKPVGSNYSIINSTVVNFTFVPDVPGKYILGLTVTDGEETSLMDSMIIVSSAIPVANAGEDINDGMLGKFNTLTGAQSYDPEGEALTYSWTIVEMPEGSEAYLNYNDRSVVKIKTPFSGIYKIALVVNDGFSNSLPDTVTVKVFGVGINSITDSKQCKIYPNPATDIVNVSINDLDFNSLTVQWIDINGKIIESTQYNGNALNNNAIQCNVPSGIRNGVYAMRLIIDGQTIVNKQVTVIR